PALNAMAARAAIRPARSTLAESAPPAVTSVPAAPAPAPFAARPVTAQAAPSPIPTPPAPQLPSPAPQAAPLTIPARPVLLRTKSGAEAVEEPVLETVPEVAQETIQATIQETIQEAAQESAAEAADTFEEADAEFLIANEPGLEPEPENRPRAILPERPMLIPAGRHLEASFVGNADYELPSLELLAEPPLPDGEEVDADELEQNALNLQQTVQDFGVRGD
ncbi:DNA translocase FtsK, partial [Methylorubrum rhodesianum]